MTIQRTRCRPGLAAADLHKTIYVQPQGHFLQKYLGVSPGVPAVHSEAVRCGLFRRENRAKKWDAGRIIGKTKMLKSFFRKEENKHSQKGEKLDTESGRILEKFYKKGR